MELTIDLDNYQDMYRCRDDDGKRSLLEDFHAWLETTGIRDMHCFEVTVTGEGPLRLRCWDGTLRDDQPCFREELMVPNTPLPESVMRWLFDRRRDAE